MSTEARQLAEKADITVNQLSTDGGYLNPEKFNEFYRVMMEGPTNLISNVRTVTMNAPQRDIDRIEFANRMFRPAPNAGTPLNADQRYRPQFGQISLNTKKIMGEIFLPYDVLEDNIERGTLEDTILNMAGQRANKDLSEAVILGYTTSDDEYLSLVDGALVTPNHQIDGSSISNVDKTLFKMGLDNLPSKYHQNKAAMRYYMSVANETNFRDKLADRATALGDEMYTASTQPFAFGVQVESEYHVPDSKMLLTYPQNIILGVQRDVTLRTKEEPSLDGVIMTMTMRFDVAMEEPDAAVTVFNLSV